jgi:hypothetical protein
MRKTQEQLLAEGFQPIREGGIFYKQISDEHFDFIHQPKGFYLDIKISNEFSNEKKMSEYLNYAKRTYGKKNSAQAFKEEHGENWALEMAYHLFKLYSDTRPRLLKSPEGDVCYIRPMRLDEPNCRKGMKVLVGLVDEKIRMKHFDNVFSNAINKGYTY